MIASRVNPESPRTTILTFGILRRIAATIFFNASTVPVCKPARRQAPEQNRDDYQAVIENRISRPRREVHNLKKPKTDQKEAWKAQSGLLLMFQSGKRVKIESRIENNQIRRNRPGSSFGVVIFMGYREDRENKRQAA